MRTVDTVGAETVVPSAVSPRIAWFSVTILLLVAIMSYLDRQIISLMVEPIKASLGVAMQMCYRVLPAASAGVVGVPDPPGVGTLGEPKSNQPSGLYAIGDGIPTVEDWGTWVKDENTFASKLQELETKAAVAGGVAHDELDVFWAAEGGLTEEDDEVFSDLDYDGGA